LALPLPANTGVAAAPDVAVVQGVVAVTGEPLWHEEGPDAFVCGRDGTAITLAWPEARFRVTVDRVVVDARDPAAAADLLVPPVWSVVLAVRERESLHACAVERDGRALAILGDSGTGKSTAGLALVDRGWRAVTDDLLTFDGAGDAVPGPPFLRLDPDRAAGRSGRRDTAGKLRVAAPTCPHPVPLAAAIVLSATHGGCGRLRGVAAVTALLDQTYSPLVVDAGQARRRFDLALDLAARVPVYAAPPRSLTVAAMEQMAEEGMR
jgi:hypothetical protein